MYRGSPRRLGQGRAGQLLVTAGQLLAAGRVAAAPELLAIAKQRVARPAWGLLPQLAWA